MSAARFIRPMHPKTAILPRPESIQRILALGWVAQLKIHGHRAQVHIPADENQPMVAFNRQGKPHQRALPPQMIKELSRLLRPEKDWNVVDAEWIKPEAKLYLFDFVKREGKLLRELTFPERWKLLPFDYLSPSLMTLSIIRDQQGCLKALASPKAHIEGVVFKSSKTPGFADTSIIRCRKK